MIKMNLYFWTIVVITVCGTHGLPPRLVKNCLLSGDACDPPLPCTYGETLPSPSNCQSYQVCVAPMQWVTQEVCKSWEVFDAQSCSCVNDTCTSWSCPPSTQVPPLEEPCFTSDPGMTCVEGTKIPDRYTCSTYHECFNNVWVCQECPPETPFFNRYGGMCEGNRVNCLQIPFDECADFPHYSACHLTSAVPVTSEAPSTEDTMTTAQNEAPVDDPCAPYIPCQYGDTLANPYDCHSYQLCVAPHEWTVIWCEAGTVFDPASCSCLPGATCNYHGCRPDIAAEPCFVQHPGSVCTEGATVPDRNKCTQYFECVSQIWTAKLCPGDRPYFDHDHRGGQCEQNHFVCPGIPFGLCQNYDNIPYNATL